MTELSETMGETSSVAPPTPKLLKARMRHTRYFILLFILLAMVTAPHWPDESMPHEAMEWLGYALVIAGTFGRVYCSTFIGGRKNDELIMEGPYSVVRNPLYVCSFIAVAGIGVQTVSFTLTLILLLAFVGYYPAVIKREEAFLLHRFGEPYRRYLQAVPRCIPKRSLWHARDELPTRPFAVLRTLMDAATFFLPFPLFEAISWAQDSGYLPVLLHLP